MFRPATQSYPIILEPTARGSSTVSTGSGSRIPRLRPSRSERIRRLHRQTEQALEEIEAEDPERAEQITTVIENNFAVFTDSPLTELEDESETERENVEVPDHPFLTSESISNPRPTLSHTAGAFNLPRNPLPSLLAYAAQILPTALPPIPSQTIPSMASADLSKLPLRTERSAPQFDEDSKDTVERYFDDLERLLKKHGITDDQASKTAAIDYIPAGVAKRWKSLPTYADAQKTYVEFRTEVLSFYLGTDAQYTWTLREYNEVIGEALRTGISSLETYMKFYGKFYPIYRYLHAKTEPELTERDASTSTLR